jgi:bacterioferritin (cytochrome b1)
VKYGAAISPQQHGEEGSMPFYHFDLINTKTVADKGEAELPDDIEAMDSADELARRLLDEHPDLRNRHYAVLVTNDDGEEICRVPLDIIH